MTPTAAYPNKQKDLIHVQSCSYIIIQNNTIQRKTCLKGNLSDFHMVNRNWRVLNATYTIRHESRDYINNLKLYFIPRIS
jgi:hypothetical protein